VSVSDVRSELAEHTALSERVAVEMADQIDRLAELVTETLRRGGKLLLCGNGGSAADAQHLAAEYVVRFGRDRAPLPALALTVDGSVLTAAANDTGFERVFERQVRALGREGDLLLLHSTSGASENLLRAADAAREIGVRTAALLGRDGGPLRGRVDLPLTVPTTSPARAQEMHITIGHVVCALVERTLFP
jgi:D-sedoheptulose 7-phosphate isomerase